MNFNINEVLSSRWMAKEDVPTSGVNLTVREVTQEAVGEELEAKLALHFHGSYKPLLLNRTNLRILGALLGNNTGEWKGKAVCVYSDPTISFGGKLVGGVRVRAPHEERPAPGGLSKEELEKAAKAYLAAQNGNKKPDELGKDDIPW